MSSAYQYGIVYKITNKINGKVYIGQTIKTIEKRLIQHKSDGNLLTRAIKKYGIESFDTEIIYNADNQDSLNNAECELITSFNSINPNGYNLREGGNGFGKWNESSKIKLSKTLKSKKLISHKRKPLLRICPKTKEIIRYPFLREIDKHGFISNAVSEICSGRAHHKTHGGFMWVYESDFDGNIDNLIEKSKRKTRVVIIATNEKETRTFIGWAEVRAAGFKPGKALRAMKNSWEHGHFYWSYKK